MTNIEITDDIKKAIISLAVKDENKRLKLSLSNIRLDFKKEYFLNSFTKKGVKLSYNNSINEEINTIAKVYANDNHSEYKLVAEHWKFVLKFSLDFGGILYEKRK